MDLVTISEVSKTFNVSTRALRYYEQIGLLRSIKKDDYAYRVYDERAVQRVQQIVVLRKLRIPLKQISKILESESMAEIIDVFRKNLSEVDDEIRALSTIRSILNTFIVRLNEAAPVDINIVLLDDVSILDIVDSLTVTKINIKEDKTMADLEKARESLGKLADKDVRIVYLPPSTVAAARCVGGFPELETQNLIRNFIEKSELPSVKPDFRHYGFNHPNGSQSDGSDHGYERWVTIPDDLEVPSPLTKKRFEGGLYAAHMIPMGAFEEWGWLWDWAHKHDKYAPNLIDDGGERMNGLLEEHLNCINNYRLSNEELDKVLQLDLLIPIKEK